MKKIFGLFALIIGLAVITFTYKDFKWNFASDGERFIQLFEDDIQDLEGKKLLPSEWVNIKEVTLQPTSPTTEGWIKTYSPKIVTNTNGNLRLEIVIIDWIDEEARGGLAQMSLIDLISGNKVWEIARTYRIDPTNDELTSNSQN